MVDQYITLKLVSVEIDLPMLLSICHVVARQVRWNILKNSWFSLIRSNLKLGPPHLADVRLDKSENDPVEAFGLYFD